MSGGADDEDVVTYSYRVQVQSDGRWAVVHENAAGREVIDGLYRSRQGARAVAAKYNARPGFGVKREV